MSLIAFCFLFLKLVKKHKDICLLDIVSSQLKVLEINIPN